MYQHFAEYYDTIAAYNYNQAAYPLMSEFIKGLPALPKWIIDWGCGTGTLACQLAADGYNVLGVDGSQPMLEQARKLQTEKQLNPDKIRWIEGDICHATLEVKADLAISMCNTLNHLITENQVAWFAQNLKKHLTPQGIALIESDTFDTFFYYFNADETVVLETPEVRITRKAIFHPETGLVDHWANRWHWDDTGHATHTEEYMQLRYYPDDFLKNTFEASGLQVSGVMPYNPLPDLYTRQIIPKQLWVLKNKE
jgi:SAM-dependent methyltransferase